MNEQVHEVAASSRELAGRGRRRASMDPLLRWRYYPRLFQWLFFAATVVLAYFAFAPGQRGEGNLATEVVWRLWWPLLPFVLLVGGRIWCGVCPFGGVSDAAASLRKSQKAAPASFRRIAPWLGVISVFGFGMAFLALGLEADSGATGTILIGMVALSFLLALFYRGRTFCRYLCPVGFITRAYSYFSWLRPHGSREKTGIMAVCPVGQSPASLRQPSQCQMCGVCTRGPEARGITTGFTAGSPRLPGTKEFGRPEAVLSLLMLGLMAADSVRMTQVFARYQHMALPYLGYNYRLTVAVGVTGLVGIILLLQLASAWFVSRSDRLPAISGEHAVDNAGSGSFSGSAFNSIGFSYLPLTMGVFMALALQHLWSGALPSLQTVLVESRLIDWAGHMPPTNVYFISIPLKIMQVVLLGTGLYFSLTLSRKNLAAAGSAGESRPGRLSGGAIRRSAMVLTAFTGFGFLFLLPMSGAC
ncbi:MAG: 4Fe-4S binding protein [Thermoleophilia bacterium]|nr:4Fe-4S binding protein [Thermoleophilia bacterium]